MNDVDFVGSLQGPPEGELHLAGRLGLGAGLARHGWIAHSTPVMPFPSVMVKILSTAGSFTISFAPEGQ